MAIKKTKNETKPNIQENGKRNVILFMGMGLNGSNTDGWMPPCETKEQADVVLEDVWKLLETIDTFILGRVTFELWESYWPLQANNPSSSEFQKKFSTFVDEIQKIVISTKLKSVDWKNSRVINDEIEKEIAQIKEEPGKNLAVVGGAGIAQTFTKLNLIDEYQLYIHQIIGSRKPILGVLEDERKLELIDLKKFGAGGLRLHYIPVKS